MNLFIRRPVLSIVISIILTLLGLLSLRVLPMTLFPSVAPPEVVVTVEYTGANAETVTKAAIMPIERAINGVPKMKYMTSLAGNDGVGLVQVVFETGTDPDVAAINVQNRVNTVLEELPPEAIKNGVRIEKEEKAMLLYLDIFSSDPSHDEKFLYNFADINVLPELKRISGVGFIDILGAKEYAMRVWLNPDKMVAHNIAADEVVAALRASNIEAAPGKIGENSDRGQSPLQYTVRYTGKFNTKEAYESIPVRAKPDGELLKIKDIARVEFDTIYYDVESKFNGRPSASILLKQRPGSNASDVIDEVKAKMAEIRRSTFMAGMDYRFSFDVSRFLDAAVHEVTKTFWEAFALVALVVFLFLQSWRATVVPLVAVPVSLVATFTFIQWMGFSLNLITLFALVLAIGIVVDNAIVIVEAVVEKLERDPSLSANAAAGKAMQEMTGAIVAITLVMASVFVPMAFLSGPAGIFYREFSVTIAVGIVLSGVVALTLTPSMCGSVLRSHSQHPPRFAKLFDGFNRAYARFESLYAGVLERVAQRPLLNIGALIGFVVGTSVVASILPSGFIPNEDQGAFYASVATPPGATLERTKVVVDRLQKAWQDDRDVESISTLAGVNILSDGTGPTFGTALVNLKPWDQRSASADEVMERLNRKITAIADANIEMFPPPPVPGYGNASGFEARLLDKTGTGDIRKMDSVAKQFVATLRATPELSTAFSMFNANYPQYMLTVDIEKAAHKGVTIDGALSALQTTLGSEYATNFIRFGQMYKVMVQAAPEFRAKPDDVLGVRVRNAQGEMVPLSAFVALAKIQGVDQLTRYNMYTSAEITGAGKSGVSSGTAIDVVKRTAAATLPHGYALEWAGISRDQVKSGNESIYIFVICLVFVYLVLAAQYESFRLPLAVILSLPPGVLGALAFLKLAGLENNIYTHLALIMLIGLLGKNAILVIEYAELKRRSGLDHVSAIFQAARQRLRPIMMTSLAFIVGLLPLVFSSGAGQVANRTIGTAAAGGMVVGTLLGGLVVPGLYLVLAPRTWRNETAAEAVSAAQAVASAGSNA